MRMARALVRLSACQSRSIADTMRQRCGDLWAALATLYQERSLSSLCRACKTYVKRACTIERTYTQEQSIALCLPSPPHR